MVLGGVCGGLGSELGGVGGRKGLSLGDSSKLTGSLLLAGHRRVGWVPSDTRYAQHFPAIMFSALLIFTKQSSLADVMFSCRRHKFQSNSAYLCDIRRLIEKGNF